MYISAYIRLILEGEKVKSITLIFKCKHIYTEAINTSIVFWLGYIMAFFANTFLFISVTLNAYCLSVYSIAPFSSLE